MMRYLVIFVALLLCFDIEAFAQQEGTFLLKPSGAFHVGTTELSVVDFSRKERLSRRVKYRKLYVKVWYPADTVGDQVPNKYFSKYSADIIYDIFKSKDVTKPEIEILKGFDTFSYPEVQLSAGQNKFPVVIFNAGYYFGMTDLYTTYMEELASNGYIVFSVIHPYHQPLVIFEDGSMAKLAKKKSLLAFLEWKLKERVDLAELKDLDRLDEYVHEVLRKLRLFDKTVDLWVADTRFLIDHLYRLNKEQSNMFYAKLDLDNIGVFGQSLGGAVAGQMCVEDKRIKAGINMDCFQFGEVVKKDFATPFMLIESEYHKKWNLGNQVIFSAKSNHFYSLLLLNTMHFVTTDVPLLPFLDKARRESFYGNVDGHYMVQTINNYVLNFFNYYLKGDSSDLLFTESMNSNYIYNIRK